MKKITGVHNLQILRGLSTNRSLLSCKPDGSKVDLFFKDDVSGRQRWEFKPVEGTNNLYNIRVSAGWKMAGPISVARLMAKRLIYSSKTMRVDGNGGN